MERERLQSVCESHLPAAHLHLDDARIYDRTRHGRGRIVPPSPELPNDWESFSIQINDTVYTLPVPLAAFLDDGWVISEEDDGLSLAGAVGPNASYEWEWISLTNDREQVVSICVFNTTESTISVAESTVGGIHVIYGNYDFSGTELRIPCGVDAGMVNQRRCIKAVWSTKR